MSTLTVLFSTVSSEASCQNNNFDTYVFDVYGLTFRIKKIFYTAKCDCCTDFNPEWDECTLVEVEIDSCFHLIDTAIFATKDEIISVKNLILYDNEDLRVDSVYFGIAHNSCSEKLLILHKRIASDKIKLVKNRLDFVHLTGMRVCYRYSFIQKIFMFLGINRKKIQRNGKLIDPDETKFIKFINDHYSNNSDS